MAEVTVRELRNHGGRVLDRVEAGEALIVTRDGRPVAELRPVRRPPLDAATFLAHWRGLPPVDPDQFRRDIDSVIEPRL